MTYADGDVYEGNWNEGNRIGKTKFEIQKESALAEEKRITEANCGKVTFEVFTFEGGDRYEGEMKDGNYHGKGKYTWADGRIYVGGFYEGNKHGHGIMKYLSYCQNLMSYFVPTFCKTFNNRSLRF